MGAEHTENIALRIETPKFDLGPIDKGIAKLTEFDRLLDRLAKTRTIRINIGVDGGQLEGAVSNMGLLEGMLRSIGKADWATKFNGGMLSIGEVARASRAELEKLQRQHGDMMTEMKQVREKWGELSERAKSGSYDPSRHATLAKQRQALEAFEAQVAAVEKQIRGLHMVHGAASSMVGLPEASQVAVQQKMTQATTAQALAQGKVATETRKQAAAVTQLAEGNDRLLRQRTRTVPGEEPSITSTYLTGAGSTRTLSGQSVTDEQNMERAAKVEFERIKADFARRRAQVGKGSPEMRELLKQEARAIDDELTKQGLQGTALHEQQRGRAAGLLQQAGHGEASAEQRAIRDAEKAYAAKLRAAEKADEAERKLAAKADADYAKRLAAREAMDEKANEAQLRRMHAVLDADRKALTKQQAADAKREDKERREHNMRILREISREEEERERAKRSRGPGFGSNLAGKIGAAAQWSLAYGAVGGGLAMLGAGADSATRIERQTATLRAVYRGTDEEAVKLRNDTLALGAAEGRSAEEAVDAAIRWARLGLTRKEAAEAVRVSLQAANVAEITSAESSEQLAAIYAAYGLEVRDLSVLLAQLNAVSNNLNVTNKDLLAGIARTGAVAKEAGVPLAELIGLIGAGVAGTGRTGAELGNAIKSSLVALANPELQNTLRERFGLDVKNRSGQLKGGSFLLSEIYQRSQSMNPTERLEFLREVGGKQQASRVAAILDNYVTGQVRAIRAQQDLNSAERESTKIRGTVVSQWQTLVTELERFVTLLASSGGDSSILSAVSGALKSMSLVISLTNDGLDRMASFQPPQWLLNLLPGQQLSQAGKLVDLINQNRGVGKNFDPEQRALAEKSSLLGSAEGTAQLMRSLAGSVMAKPDGVLRSLPMAASALPEDRREAFQNEVASLLRVRDLQAAITRLKREAAFFDDEAARLTKEQASMRASLAARLEQEIGSEDKLIEARKKQGLSTSEQEAERSRMETQLAKLRGDVRGGALDELSGEYDPLAEVQKRMARQIGYRMDAAGVMSSLPFPRGTESEKTARAYEDAVRRRMLATSYTPQGEEETSAFQRILHGEGGQGGLLRKLDEEIEKAQADRLTAAMRDNMAEGMRVSDRRMGAFGFGLNETARLTSQAKGGMGLLDDALQRNRIALGLGGDGASEAAEVLQLGVRLNQTQLALEERRYAIARDIVQARLEENEAASKALVMASREDQVRAALLAKFQQDNGGKAFSNSTFAFFDDATKRAVEQFKPDLLPSGARNNRQKLEEEERLLSGTIANLRDALESAIGRAGTADVRVPQTTSSTPLPPPPQINLPPVTFNLGSEMQSFLDAMENLYRGEFRSEMDGLRSMVSAHLARTGVARGQNAGADVVIGGD